MAVQVHSLVEAADVVRPDWNGYNILHDSASRVSALDIGFLPGPNADKAPSPKLVWLLNADDWQPEDIPKDAVVIYQVSWGASCSCHGRDAPLGMVHSGAAGCHSARAMSDAGTAHCAHGLQTNLDVLVSCWQGHHGDRGAMRADIVLPTSAYTEKSGTYVNMEGRPQQTKVGSCPTFLQTHRVHIPCLAAHACQRSAAPGLGEDA